MKYHLLDKDGLVVFSNLPQDHMGYFLACTKPSEIIPKCEVDGVKERHGKKANEHGVCYLLTDDTDLINSSLLFRTVLDLYCSFLSETASMREQVLRDILHNITTIHAHNIQELYALVPQDLLTKNLSAQIQTIESTILKDLRQAAYVFMRIAKNNASLKAQFTALKLLYYSGTNLQFKFHSVREVLLNALHNFFQDFTDKGVNIQITEDTRQVKIDYETFSAALVPFLDNAVKYCKPNSTLFVKFKQGEKFSILFDMVSLQILPEESKSIFLKGQSGTHATKTGKKGSGIGLYNVNKLLAFNKAELVTHLNQDVKQNVIYKGLPYENNIFEIRFL